MALAKLIPKTCSLLLRSNLPKSLVPAVTYSSQPKEKKKGIWWKLFGYHVREFDEDGNELGCPSDEDLAVGMWKKELDAYKSGDQDPYKIAAIDRGDKGTKIDPIRVPSAVESRLIQCRCHEDNMTLIPMFLHQNEPKRCRCGYWMVLYYTPPFVIPNLPQ